MIQTQHMAVIAKKQSLGPENNEWEDHVDDEWEDHVDDEWEDD